MRRKLALVLFLSFMLTLSGVFPAAAQADKSIKILWNGKIVKSDVSPVIKEGRVLVPLRAIAENFGLNVEWDAENRLIKIEYEGIEFMEFKIGVNSVYHTYNYGYEGGMKGIYFVDVAPVIVNNRTMVPLRIVADALGLNVEWDAAARTVRLSGNITDGFFVDYKGKEVRRYSLEDWIKEKGKQPPYIWEKKFDCGDRVEWYKEVYTIYDPLTGEEHIAPRGMNFDVW